MQVIKDHVIDFEKFISLPKDADDVKPASHWTQEVIDRIYLDPEHSGSLLPWSKSHNKIQLRTHEVSVWAGYNGSGKSLVLNQIVYGLLHQNQRVLIISLEMKPVATMTRMTRQATGLEIPAPDYIRAFNEWTDNKLWIYDRYGSTSTKKIMCVANYAFSELNINHIVIDSLMKCDIDVDGYNEQKRFISQICAYAQDTGVHVHLIAHSKKSESEKKRLDKMDIKGTSEITDQVDNVFMFWRNKTKEEAVEKGSKDFDDKPDAYLGCVKQRHGEWEGNLLLWFHKPSQQYLPDQKNKPINVFNWSKAL